METVNLVKRAGSNGDECVILVAAGNNPPVSKVVIIGFGSQAYVTERGVQVVPLDVLAPQRDGRSGTDATIAREDTASSMMRRPHSTKSAPTD